MKTLYQFRYYQKSIIPKVVMQRYSLYITMVGAGLAFFCFFLPWIKFISPEIANYSLSSLRIGLPLESEMTRISGFFIATYAMNITTFALITTLLILSLCIYRLILTTPWKFRTILLIISGAGFYCTLYTIIQLNPLLEPETRKIIALHLASQQIEFANIYQYKVGGIGTLLGFILAFIGVSNIPKEIPSNSD